MTGTADSTPHPPVSAQQFAWGLANGITVLAISGMFWFGLAAWTISLTAFLLVILPVVAIGAFLIRGGIMVRRRFPGFSPRSLRTAPKGSPTRRILVGFYAITGAQWLSIVVIGAVCSAAHRPDLIWPLIGLVISVHFLPLGWLFGVRAYYVLGATGTLISLAAILALSGGTRVVAGSMALGLVTVAGAIYLISKANSLITST